ncbi:uncharacterized protein EAE97_004519 [Botrytis byssoidea]|uniref:Delta 8-(E)-sphingolipid desaturase n=1 Tax=Botrytis byssoidea TaxID=139641 RepID=A0A9P5M6M9_9HELO|nr:uncharacterized protein EAE97_004519 [Botrytis byssoidea]KAF7947270.1 hypothetical protein EAE97_004519 [Botrytis byssoidea]
MPIPIPVPSQHRLISRPEIKSLIAKDHKIFILNNCVIKADAWLPFHPGGEKSILHMVSRDATDEINALHSEEARERMRKYVVGRIEGGWEGLGMGMWGGEGEGEGEEGGDRGGKLRVLGDGILGLRGCDAEKMGKGEKVRWRRTAAEIQISHASSSSSSSSSSLCSIDTKTKTGKEKDPENPPLTSLEVLTAHAISTDLSKYPSLDRKTQDAIISQYRLLDQELRSAGLYNCPYRSYGIDVLRYILLFTLFWKFLQSSYFIPSALSLRLFWHQLVFTAHDAGHMGITHSFHIDNCTGILLANFLGGLSIGWWKRNHNIHHIATNSPEHDPDIAHLPFFAISHRFFSSLYSSYYNRAMEFNTPSRFFVKYQTYLYYPILLLGRFNLYVLASSYLLSPNQAPRKGPAWWH